MSNPMQELMNDLGVSSFEELQEFMKQNPNHEIVIQLKELFLKVNETEHKEHGA